MSTGHQLLPARVYVINALVLGGLMLLTVGAYYAPLGRFEFLALPIAMVIAILKATFLILIFMNVKYSSSLTKLFAASGFFWFLILIAFTMADFLLPELGSPYLDLASPGKSPLP